MPRGEKVERVAEYRGLDGGYLKQIQYLKRLVTIRRSEQSKNLMVRKHMQDGYPRFCYVIDGILSFDINLLFHQKSSW